MNNIKLIPLEDRDRDQFILDNQEAFNYGAMEEFGKRDDHLVNREESKCLITEKQNLPVILDL